MKLFSFGAEISGHGFSMPLYDRLDELDRRTAAKWEWFIGYAFTDNGEQVSTVIDACSAGGALKQFEVNFWQIAFSNLSDAGPPGVRPHDLHEIMEDRPAGLIPRTFSGAENVSRNQDVHAKRQAN